MIESETDHAKNAAVARAVINRVRAAIRNQIRGLDVDCDGEVVVIRGEVDILTSNVWRSTRLGSRRETARGCLHGDLQGRADLERLPQLPGLTATSDVFGASE